jgi:hypothetical protein
MLCIGYITNFLFISVFIVENLFLYYSYKDLILNYCRRILLRIAELKSYQIYDFEPTLNES